MEETLAILTMEVLGRYFNETMAGRGIKESQTKEKWTTS